MANKNPTFQLYADFYPEVLLHVRGITFTPQHIDIIACLINGEKDNRIAQLLSIREGTVETHKNNIRHEIQKKSHEDIIRFTHKSKNIALIRNHYLRLLFKFDFEKELKALAVLAKRKNLVCLIKPDTIHKERLKTNPSFTRLLSQHLELAGIVIAENEVQSDHNTWTLHVDSAVIENSQNHIHLLYKAMETFPDEKRSPIDFRDPQYYFSSLILLLKNFFSDTEFSQLETLISTDNDRNHNFYKNDFGSIALNQSFLSTQLQTLQKRKPFLWGIFSLACFLVIGISLYVSYHKIFS